MVTLSLTVGSVCARSCGKPVLSMYCLINPLHMMTKWVHDNTTT